MTVFDYVMIGIIAVSLVLGLWRGVIGELIALAAWGLALFAAMEFGAAVGRGLYTGIADPDIRVLAGCVTIFIGVLVIMGLIRLAVRGLIKALGLSLSDRLLGSLFGLARGVLIAMVLVALGGLTAAPRQVWWQEATLSAPLETAVMAVRPWLPDDLAKRIRFS
jgi:membrane protein required for colicin V production